MQFFCVRGVFLLLNCLKAPFFLCFHKFFTCKKMQFFDFCTFKSVLGVIWLLNCLKALFFLCFHWFYTCKKMQFFVFFYLKKKKGSQKTALTKKVKILTFVLIFSSRITWSKISITIISFFNDRYKSIIKNSPQTSHKSQIQSNFTSFEVLYQKSNWWRSRGFYKILCLKWVFSRKVS